MPLHGPAGAASTLGNGVAVGVGAEDSVGVGVAATCVVALPEGEGDAPVVGDGEAATLQLARRPAAAAPIASPRGARLALGGETPWHSCAQPPVQCLLALGFNARVTLRRRTGRTLGDLVPPARWPQRGPQEMARRSLRAVSDHRGWGRPTCESTVALSRLRRPGSAMACI